MTHEAGFWIFGIITLICLSVWLLCRRSKAVEESYQYVIEGIMDEVRQNQHAPFHYDPPAKRIALNFKTPAESGWCNDAAQLAPVQPYPVPTIVTKPLPKGWQGWEGGEQPVPDDTMVVVMLKDGTMDDTYPANLWDWEHRTSGGDIVAWRVA